MNVIICQPVLENDLRPLFSCVTLPEKETFMKFFVKNVFILSLVFVAFIHQAHAACSVGDKAQVEWKGAWYPATVLKTDGEECYIHYDGYASSWDEWVGPARIKLTSASAGASASSSPASWSEGDPVQVKWKNSWWPAHVLKVKGDQLYIHYDGYDNSWDEWVGPERYKKK